MSSLLPRCPRCGLSNTTASASCRNCGQSLAAGALVAAPGGTSTTPAHTSTSGAGSGVPWWRPGWRVVEGRVINVDAPYMAAREMDWGMLALKSLVAVVLLIFVGPILLGVLLGLLFFWAMLSFLLPGRGGGGGLGIISSTFNHAVGYLFSKRLSRGAADVPVRDVRVRDAAGTEHLVRLRGHVVSGSVNVGDDIRAEGPDRGGTLLLRRGWNRRINSEIRLRER